MTFPARSAGNHMPAGDGRMGTVSGVISVVVSDRSALVVVGGHPTAAQARQLGERIGLLLQLGMSVTVELTGLEICSSPVLEALVRTRQRAVYDGAELTFAEPGPAAPRHVASLLALVGLTGTLARPS